jgi:hypothetical protein
VTVHLRLDGRALDHLLNSPSGPVGLHMKRIGVRIYTGAMRISGRDTGELRAKMYTRQGRTGRTQYVEVGSNAPHAHMHHDGTPAHQIIPNTGRILRFNVGGRVVYAQETSHPGTEGTHFLTIPMRRAVR